MSTTHNPQAFDANTQARCAQLRQHLRQLAQTEQGLPFEQFMHHALYSPGLGYYTAHHPVGSRGQGGDFITAPQLSPLFAYSLAQALVPVFEAGLPVHILECGAGTGQLAFDVMSRLHQLGVRVQSYSILEVSTSLRQQQQKTLQSYDCVQWLDAFPVAFEGLVLGNELLDAMPVAAYEVQASQLSVYERRVQWNDAAQQWQWFTQPISGSAAQAVLALLPHGTRLALQQGHSQSYQLEVGHQAQAWVSSMANHLKCGLIMLIDYGFPRHELYHQQRQGGTLMAHIAHRAHSDVLQHVGQADITAHVDFTAVAQAAQAQGLDVLGYTNQARFLINVGIAQAFTDLSAGLDVVAQGQLARNIQLLMSEAEMGELFKVIALGKDCAMPLGFDTGDRSHRLLDQEVNQDV